MARCSTVRFVFLARSAQMSSSRKQCSMATFRRSLVYERKEARDGRGKSDMERSKYWTRKGLLGGVRARGRMEALHRRKARRPRAAMRLRTWAERVLEPKSSRFHRDSSCVRRFHCRHTRAHLPRVPLSNHWKTPRTTSSHSSVLISLPSSSLRSATSFRRPNTNSSSSCSSLMEN
uniref:Uncharacterized protein n=1 Tax=Lepeophtheirus salmonis TaxID=72036 RepID=A0A0K2UGZ0_LEPSM